MARRALSHVALGLWLGITPVFALERSESLIGPDDRDGDRWASSTTCSLVYYNTCTGWVWNWAGWEPESRLGVVFDHCCPSGGVLAESWINVKVGMPSGYGYTGTIQVFDGDSLGCPTQPRGPAQPFLPSVGWNQFVWNLPVSERFVVLVTHGAGAFNPVSYFSDHPAAGPTGPPACGTCYPSSRVIHSFTYGTAPAPACPGQPLWDGTCDTELMWDATVSCGGPTAVREGIESRTFAMIKALYR